jgi:imidazolonepropionase
MMEIQIMRKGTLLVKNAAQVVTCSGFAAKKGKGMLDLGIIENGAVVIKNGIIQEVGKSGEIVGRYENEGYEVIDARGKAVLPGFVDCHTHFLFAGDRAEEFSWRLQGLSYMEILKRGGGILNTVSATRSASKEKLFETGLKLLDRMLSFGITTVEGKSGYGLDYETEIKQLEVMRELDAAHPVDVVRTYLGAHVVPREYTNRSDSYIDYIIESVLPAVAEKSLAEFCDVFCDHGVFSIQQSRKLLLRAKDMGLGLKIHADEIAPLGGAELAAELGTVSADHLLRASDEGINKMAAKGVTGVLLPGTAFCLKEEYARARYMIDQNLAVALATDLNPGTFFSESIPLVCALAVLHMGMSTEEAVTACTLNAAAAIGRADQIGSINTGKSGDIIVLEYPSYKYIPYRTGVNSVEKVIKKGVMVYDRISH